MTRSSPPDYPPMRRPLPAAEDGGYGDLRYGARARLAGPPPAFDGSSSAVLDLLVAAFKFRRRILLGMAITMAVGLGAALLTHSSYVANSTVLATMSADYSARPDAGSTTPSYGSLQQGEIVRTERDILSNDDLHRAVLRQIGPQVLYPELFKTPSGLAKVMQTITALPQTIAGALGSNAAPPPVQHDPVEMALPLFDAAFSTEAARDSTAISLSFKHRDPALAARVLNTLMATYLRMRRDLYNSPQSAIVEAQVKALRTQVKAADAALNQYKATHNIGDFKQRQIVLETNQGDAERKYSDITGQIAQAAATVDNLTAQLKKIPPQIVTQSDVSVDTHAAPEHQDVVKWQNQLNRDSSLYQPDSAIVRHDRALLAQAERAQSERQRDGHASSVRTADNPIYTTAKTDLLKAEQALYGARAYQAKLRDYLEQVAQQLRRTTALNADLTQLEEQRTIATNAYANAEKELEQRKLIDMVDARKQTSVRIMEPAVTPIRADGVRKLIGLMAIVASLLVGGLIAILSNYWRRYYLTPSELERDINLPVLASIYEQRMPNLPHGVA